MNGRKRAGNRRMEGECSCVEWRGESALWRGYEMSPRANSPFKKVLTFYFYPVQYTAEALSSVGNVAD